MDQHWMTANQIIRIGFDQSNVVMMNEAHNHMLRCIRTRLVGRDVLLSAHEAGVRYLAMEALSRSDMLMNQTRTAASSRNEIFSQIEMKEMVQTALNLGWELITYDADTRDYLLAKSLDPDYKNYHPEEWERIVCTNDFWKWREVTAAQALADQAMALPEGAKMFVWVGWQHHSRKPVLMFDEDKQHTMGHYYEEIAGQRYFSIDQTTTIFDDPLLEPWRAYAQNHTEILSASGGTAGFLRANLPSELQQLANLHLHDAYLLSIENDMQ